MTAPSWLMVVPVIDGDLADQLIRSLDNEYRPNVAVVDNTGQNAVLPAVGRKLTCGYNIGVARAWNWARDIVISEEIDQLWLCSSSMRFTDGGQDLVGQMDQADEWGLNVYGAGWHLQCLTRRTLEVVGSFDEHFYPAYFEDTDYLYRMGLAGLPSPRENERHMPFINVSAASAGDALAIKRRRVNVDFAWLEAYYTRKWGGRQGEERFTSPFNTGFDWTWWP